MKNWGYSIIRSSLCDVGVVWIEEAGNLEIARIFIFKKNNGANRVIKRFFPKAKKAENNKIGPFLNKFKRYLNGEAVCFHLQNLRSSACSDFQWSVLLAARRIPRGRVLSYNDLARLINKNSARAAGNALAKNPFPLIIPCHRIVCSNGKPGGFQPGEALKKRLLGLEGITFDRKGKIGKKFFISN